MVPSIDIAFACLPFRSVSRLDVPMDASPQYRARVERMKAALQTHGAERTYYLYDAHCVFRFANSEVEGMVRFEFEGIVRTDAGDLLTNDVDLEVILTGETCGIIPPEVELWLRERVHRAVAIEFDRFIAAGHLSACAENLGQLERLSDLSAFSGMHV